MKTARFDANPAPCAHRNCKRRNAGRCLGQGDPWLCYEKAKLDLYHENLTPDEYDRHIREIIDDLGI